VVAASRRCGGAALSAKRVSSDSGIRSSFGGAESVLPAGLLLCAAQVRLANTPKIAIRFNPVTISPLCFLSIQLSVYSGAESCSQMPLPSAKKRVAISTPDRNMFKIISC
jgi:hypothetical protein